MVNKAASVALRRGTVWWAELPDPVGSGPGSRRPVVIVSADAFNASHIQTVVVVVLTSNLRLIDAPGNVRVRAKEAGLPRESVANVSQVLTIDKEVLTERAGYLRRPTLEGIASGLRLVFDL